jgi:GNAT superfamily N-acetyltransferase
MIRNATEADIPIMIEIGKNLASSTTYKTVNYSEERIEKTIRTLMDFGFCVVAEKDGEIVGGMMGDVYTPWYSNDRMGIDYTLYIEPEHRNGLLAVKMVKRFEQWCISMGAKQIRPGIGTGDKNAIRLYKALGYKSVGEWFLKDV